MCGPWRATCSTSSGWISRPDQGSDPSPRSATATTVTSSVATFVASWRRAGGRRAHRRRPLRPRRHRTLLVLCRREQRRPISGRWGRRAHPFLGSRIRHRGPRALRSRSWPSRIREHPTRREGHEGERPLRSSRFRCQRNADPQRRLIALFGPRPRLAATALMLAASVAANGVSESASEGVETRPASPSRTEGSSRCVVSR